MFELDGEYTVPAAFSGALLFAAAYAAWRVNKLDPDRSWICLAILFAFMGVDEVAGLHEALTEWTGIHWQILYIPIVAIAAVDWLAALKRARPIGLAGGLVLGAAAWVIAQLIELVSFGPGGMNSESTIAIFAEELGEMTGSSLFLLGLLTELVHCTGRGAQRAAAPASASATSSTADLASSGSSTAASPA